MGIEYFQTFFTFFSWKVKPFRRRFFFGLHWLCLSFTSNWQNFQFVCNFHSLRLVLARHCGITFKLHLPITTFHLCTTATNKLPHSFPFSILFFFFIFTTISLSFPFFFSSSSSYPQTNHAWFSPSAALFCFKVWKRFIFTLFLPELPLCFFIHSVFKFW